MEDTAKPGIYLIDGHAFVLQGLWLNILGRSDFLLFLLHSNTATQQHSKSLSNGDMSLVQDVRLTCSLCLTMSTVWHTAMQVRNS